MAGNPTQFMRKDPSAYMDKPADEYSPQQLYILQSFQSQVYIQDKMDVQDEPIYDTITFDVGETIDSNTSAWFDDVGSRSGKTLAETNMTKSRTLIAPEAQAVFQYRLKLNEDIDPRNALAITRQFAYQFNMGTKAYQTGPPWLYNAGGGLFWQGTNSDLGFMQIGLPSSISSQALSVNLVIENEESFFANLVGNPFVVLGTPDALAVVRIQCLLMGLHARPIR